MAEETRYERFEGGCLCGLLRYESTAPTADAGYCHCRLCQRSSGAPVLAWGAFPIDHFAYRKGSPRIYQSSPHARREFCGSCGTQIAFVDTQTPATVDVNLATLDVPEAVKPAWHIWTSSRIAWFDTADRLPRYPDDGPARP